MRAGRMDRIVSLYQESSTTNDFGEQITTLIPLCLVGAEKSTGTLTIGTLYQITATATNYFYDGCAVGDVWTATLATACTATNKVKPVTRGYREWAERLELRGDERWQSMQVVGSIQCLYKIRYRDDVSVLNVLTDSQDNKEYNINYIKQLGRKEGLELLCSARAE